MKISDLKIVIENPKGSYKSFKTEGDPIWSSYPLKGVTYPVNYGYIDGYRGEDGSSLDVFVGSGENNGDIKVWRLDVPEETKFFINLTEKELQAILDVFKPVLVKNEILSEKDFISELEKFKR